MEIEENSKPVITIKSWNAVALWSWSTNIENCAICKELLCDPCLMCVLNEDNEETDKEEKKTEEKSNIDCKPVWSACNHPFHDHCIKKWLDQQQKCPLCSTTWAYRPEDKYKEE